MFKNFMDWRVRFFLSNMWIEQSCLGLKNAWTGELGLKRPFLFFETYGLNNPVLYQVKNLWTGGLETKSCRLDNFSFKTHGLNSPVLSLSFFWAEEFGISKLWSGGPNFSLQNLWIEQPSLIVKCLDWKVWNPKVVGWAKGFIWYKSMHWTVQS